MANPPVQISPQQIMAAFNAGLNFLGLDTTLVPGNLRPQIAVLEVVLNSVLAGQMIVVSPPPVKVESDSKAGDGAGGAPDGEGPQTRPQTSVDDTALPVDATLDTGAEQDGGSPGRA